jgi:hypothetical protein
MGNRKQPTPAPMNQQKPEPPPAPPKPCETYRVELGPVTDRFETRWLPDGTVLIRRTVFGGDGKRDA